METKTYKKRPKQSNEEQEYQETVKETREYVGRFLKVSDIDKEIKELQDLKVKLLAIQ